jgi:hypothetical protein
MDYQTKMSDFLFINNIDIAANIILGSRGQEQ